MARYYLASIKPKLSQNKLKKKNKQTTKEKMKPEEKRRNRLRERTRTKRSNQTLWVVKLLKDRLLIISKQKGKRRASKKESSTKIKGNLVQFCNKKKIIMLQNICKKLKIKRKMKRKY